jgi:hypothetical protein
LHRYLQEHPDVRDHLMRISTLHEARAILDTLQSRYAHLSHQHSDNNDDEAWNSLASSHPSSSWYRRHRVGNARAQQQRERTANNNNNNNNDIVSSNSNSNSNNSIYNVDTIGAAGTTTATATPAAIAALAELRKKHIKERIVKLKKLRLEKENRAIENENVSLERWVS